MPLHLIIKINYLRDKVKEVLSFLNNRHHLIHLKDPIQIFLNQFTHHH